MGGYAIKDILSGQDKIDQFAANLIGDPRFKGMYENKDVAAKAAKEALSKFSDNIKLDVPGLEIIKELMYLEKKQGGVLAALGEVKDLDQLKFQIQEITRKGSDGKELFKFPPPDAATKNKDDLFLNPLLGAGKGSENELFSQAEMKEMMKDLWPMIEPLLRAFFPAKFVDKLGEKLTGQKTAPTPTPEFNKAVNSDAKTSPEQTPEQIVANIKKTLAEARKDPKFADAKNDEEFIAKAKLEMRAILDKNTSSQITLTDAEKDKIVEDSGNILNMFLKDDGKDPQKLLEQAGGAFQQTINRFAEARLLGVKMSQSGDQKLKPIESLVIHDTQEAEGTKLPGGLKDLRDNENLLNFEFSGPDKEDVKLKEMISEIERRFSGATVTIAGEGKNKFLSIHKNGETLELHAPSAEANNDLQSTLNKIEEKLKLKSQPEPVAFVPKDDPELLIRKATTSFGMSNG